MDFGFSPAEEAFREEVRHFLTSQPLDKFPCQGADHGFGQGT